MFPFRNPRDVFERRQLPPSRIVDERVVQGLSSDKPNLTVFFLSACSVLSTLRMDNCDILGPVYKTISIPYLSAGFNGSYHLSIMYDRTQGLLMVGNCNVNETVPVCHKIYLRLEISNPLLANVTTLYHILRLGDNTPEEFLFKSECLIFAPKRVCRKLSVDPTFKNASEICPDTIK